MTSWRELPRDLLRLISEKLTLYDHKPFSGVCTLWRSIAHEYRSIKYPTNVPGLMIPGSTNSSSQTRRFLAFPVGNNINQEHDLPLLSVPHESLCRGSHQGWLVMVDKNMSMYLLNPFSRIRIDLPPVTALPKPHPEDTCMSKWYVIKGFLSATPSTSTSDCFVMVVYGRNELAFCKLGDKAWKLIGAPKPWGYIDAIFYKEQFYVVHHYGQIFVCDLTAAEPKMKELGDLLPPRPIPYVQNWYLVESGGELLQVLRKVNISGEILESDESDGSGSEYTEDGGGGNDETNNSDDHLTGKNEDTGSVDENGDINESRDDDDDEFDDYDYDNNYESSIRNFTCQPTQFEVFKLDSSGSELKWIDVKNFDGEALFLGFNQSFLLPNSSLEGGCKENRIYYTDGNIGGHKLYIHSGYDMGVFNLEDYS